MPVARSTGIDAIAMTYKLSSGRRYLNGELVDPPELGVWVEADLFPELDYDDLATAGLFEICVDEDDWEELESWLGSLMQSRAPLFFLLGRCCDDGEVLPDEMIETRLKDCSQAWVGACMAVITNAPHAIASELLGVVSWAVRIERARRLAEAEPEQPKRSTLVVHHGRPSNQLDMFKPLYGDA